MKLCLIGDSLCHLPFEEMLDTAASLGYEKLEIQCGGWSNAPHIDLDAMLSDEKKRTAYMDAIKARGLEIAALNCSGNQLDPSEEGKEHQSVVEKTFRLAEMLGVKKIVMMSGLPGANAEDTTANWINSSWPPITLKILEWQWNEVLIPYWEKTVKEAKERGIEKIALENHARQLVYNPETLMQLRNQVGDTVGMNLDPAHHFWMGGDPIAALRFLGDAVHHLHAKDTRLERGYVDINGVLDAKNIDKFAERSWNYVALGHGHDVSWWKEFLSIASMIGYTGSVSLEIEDQTMDRLAAVKKSTKVLKEAMPRDF